jgi:hypothetical protein
MQQFGGIIEFQAAGAQNSSVHLSLSQETTPRPVDQAYELAVFLRTSSAYPSLSPSLGTTPALSTWAATSPET